MVRPLRSVRPCLLLSQLPLPARPFADYSAAQPDRDASQVAVLPKRAQEEEWVRSRRSGSSSSVPRWRSEVVVIAVGEQVALQKPSFLPPPRQEEEEEESEEDESARRRRRKKRRRNRTKKKKRRLMKLMKWLPMPKEELNR